MAELQNIKGKFLRFVETEVPKTFKTKVWDVTTLDRNGLLGQIRWFAQWRKYTFYPTATTLFDFDCLTEIAEFVKKETDTHES